MALAQPLPCRTIIACLALSALTGCGGDQHDTPQRSEPQPSGQTSTQQQPETPGAGGQVASTANPTRKELEAQPPQATCPYAGVYIAGVPNAKAPNGATGGMGASASLLVVGVDQAGMLDGVFFDDSGKRHWQRIQGTLAKPVMAVSARDASGQTAVKFSMHFAHDADGHNVLEVRDLKGAGKQQKILEPALEHLVDAPAPAEFKVNEGLWLVWGQRTVDLSDIADAGVKTTLRIENTPEPGHKRLRWRYDGLELTGRLLPTSVTGMYTAELTLTGKTGRRSVNLTGRAITRHISAESVDTVMLFASGPNAHVWIEAFAEKRR